MSWVLDCSQLWTRVKEVIREKEFTVSLKREGGRVSAALTAAVD